MIAEDKTPTQSLFRVAAIFYGNDPDNYGNTNAQNIRKLIDLALLPVGKKGLKIDEISDYILTNFLLEIDTKEISEIIANPRFSENYLPISKAGEIYYVLSEKRRLIIEARENTPSLKEYITEYLSVVSSPNTAEFTIIHYLYGIFTSNLESFRRLFQLKKTATLTIDVNTEYSEEETVIINGFLNWENKCKDEAIFRFASYALEYCMMTNRRDTQNIMDVLGGKEFFIDTNILYRAIGLNGDDRKKRTLQLLRKLKETGCKLFITIETKKEFIDSLKDKYARLRHDHNPAVRSEIFQEFITYDDIYSAYHRWCVGKANTSVDFFESYIQETFEELKSTFDIQTDGNCPFIKEDKQDILDKMAKGIMSNSRQKTFQMSLRDASNVLWVESKRTPAQQSVFSAKHFLLSSDKGLRYWDIVRNDGRCPRIVVHPSEWLSLILRYSHRSMDDYKSFISFLTLRHQDSPMSNEELHIAINSIAEIAQNIDIQKTTCENIIRISFDRSGEGLTEESIRQLAKQEAERVLEKQLQQATRENAGLNDKNNRLTDENLKLKEKIEVQKQDAVLKITELEKQNEELQGKANKFDIENQKLQEQVCQKQKELEDERAKQRKRKQIVWIVVRIIIAIILVVFLVSYLVISVDSDNFLGRMKFWVKRHEDVSNLVDNGMSWVVGVIVLAIFPWKPLRAQYRTRKSHKNK